MTISVLIGDVRARLAELPADHFDCVVTSPPYWGLRDYGVDGQIGQERTLGEHIDVMVEVFRAVRRVLKPAGTLWLNYGDCYATTPNGRSAADTKLLSPDDRTFRDKPMSTVGPIREPLVNGRGQFPKRALLDRNDGHNGHARPSAGPIHPPESGQPFPRGIGRRGGGNAPAGAVYVPDYEKTERSGEGENKGNLAGSHGGRIISGGYLKPKDLCMIPNRLAIALQEDGWWVRSEIIWGKPNPMPDSSGRYRPATAHEKVFLLTKSDEGGFWTARDTGEISVAPDLTERCVMVTTGELGNRWIELGHYYDAQSSRMGRVTDADPKMPDNWDTTVGLGGHGTVLRSGRQKGERTDKQRGHSRRHEGLNERWDAHGEAKANGGRNLRNFERAPLPVWEISTRPFKEAHFATFPPELVERCLRAGCPPGGAVLDPFGGSGTTALVADYLGFHATLIELNPAYVDIAELRLKKRASPPPAGDLFATGAD